MHDNKVHCYILYIYMHSCMNAEYALYIIYMYKHKISYYYGP